MAYPTIQTRPDYDQPGPYLNVESTPVPDITSWSPSRGTFDTKIQVYFTTLYPLVTAKDPVFFLMFGLRKCEALLQKSNQAGGVCEYNVTASVPEFSSMGVSASTVPLVVFMESRDGDVMWKVDVGTFIYVDNGEQSGMNTPQDMSGERNISADDAKLMKSPAKRTSSQQLRPKDEYGAAYGYALTDSNPSYSPYIQSDAYENLVSPYPGSRPVTVYQGQQSRHLADSTSSLLTASPPSLKAQSPQIGNWTGYGTVGSNIDRGSVLSNAGVSRPASSPEPSLPTNSPLIRTSTLRQTLSPATTSHGGHPSQHFNAYALHPRKANLEIQGDLDAMAQNWSAEELESQRRLVLFRRSQSGSTITTSFQPISVDDRLPNSVCISCIYWKEKQECFVTSVDTVYLLEQLVAARFTVEETNRIRRNLEGFRPLTVSKTGPDSEGFFKVIMNFPAPKPRNIEKDVKLFHWKDLASALKKIIGKYCTSPLSNLPPGLALMIPVSSTGRDIEGSSAGLSNPSDQHSANCPPPTSGSPTSMTDNPMNYSNSRPSTISKDGIESFHPSVTQSPKMSQCPDGDRDSTSSSSQACRDPSSPNVQKNDTQKRSSIPHSEFSPGGDTPSSITDDDTDWSEDDVNNSPQSSRVYSFSKTDQLDRGEIKEILVAPILSLFKNQLVDRIMMEFWLIFNKENEIIHATISEAGSTNSSNDHVNMAIDGGGQSSSAPGQGSHGQVVDSNSKPSSTVGGKHQRDDQDNKAQDNGDGRYPKKPRTLLSPPRSQDNRPKFACPYRKRDPRKYCVQNWRTCALAALDSVARVKGHLYRHHRIFPCQRCNVLFKNADAVDMHLKEPKGCEPNDCAQADGVTSQVYEKLRSKKKMQRDQTEEDRWKEIYKLLFPKEMIPSPYFEAVQEDLMLSPNSRELGDYEEYCRRQLPREFQAALVEIVNNESQPIEESIRSQLTSIIKDCQDRVFLKYRSTVELRVDTPSRIPTSPRTSMMGSSALQNIIVAAAELPFRTHTPPIFQSPSELPNQISEVPESIRLSDSGDNSETPTLYSRPSPLVPSSRGNPPLSDSQFRAEFQSSPDLAQSRLSTENEDDNGTFTAETFEDSWFDFDAELVEQDDFIPLV